MEILISTHEVGRTETIGILPMIGIEAARRGHSVSAVQSLSTPTPDAIPLDVLDVLTVRSPWWARSWLFYRAWRRQLSTVLADRQPDLVVASTRGLVPTKQAARQHDIPVVGIYIGLSSFRFSDTQSGHDKTPQFTELPWSARLQYLFIRSLYRQHSDAVDDFASIITVSDFLRNCLRQTFGAEATVFRTPVTVESVRATNRTREAIAMINPRTELKGASIALDVAAALPDQKFIIAGTFADERTARRARQLDNVELLGWVDDIRTVYERTKLLLVPSLVEEGGPRVISEAFANGIPVVGTHRGATPEFVADAGAIVTEPTNIDQWVDRIRTVLADQKAYERRASERIDQFDFKKQSDDIFGLLTAAASE